MERISEFCSEHKTKLLIGGITIICLQKIYSKSKQAENEKTKPKCIVNAEGDVLNYALPHVKPGYDAIYFSGLPNGLNLRSFKALYDLFFKLIFRLEKKEVDFLNARTRDLNLHECGFELINYKEKFDQSEWDSTENQKQFEEEVSKLILERFPGAKINQWYGVLFRGDEGQNPAAVDGPHVDNYPDLKKAEQWRAGYKDKYTEEEDPEKKAQLMRAKKYMMIGLWKPINMKNPVLDHPLAVMDKSTWRPWEDCVEFRQDMEHIDDGEVVQFRNLGGHMYYNKEQKWYYYPEMKSDEMILFTHVTSTNGEANPHTSFTHPNAPKDGDFDTRKSMESRVMIYWPQDDEIEAN